MSIMIQKIFHKKKLFALIIDRSFRKLKDVNFLTSPKDTQQIGYMKHKKNHVILPHIHKKRLTKNRILFYNVLPINKQLKKMWDAKFKKKNLAQYLKSLMLKKYL